MEKLRYPFFHRNCLDVGRDLVGKILVHRTENGEIRLRISETEAYWGESDTACHVSKGRTPRTEVFFLDAGTLYVYLCYGMHWMLNIVTGDVEDPQAVLIRACVEAPGPGKLTKLLGVTGELNRDSILTGPLWVEDDGLRCRIQTDRRVGIGYADREDQEKHWRFKMGEILQK